MKRPIDDRKAALVRANEEASNRFDLNLFRLISDAELHGLNTNWSDKDRRSWMAVAKLLKDVRPPVRDMMHPQLRVETVS